MKYTLKIFFVVLISAVILTGVIWVFSSAERQYALNQYISIHQNSANDIQYMVQDNIEKYTDAENNVDYQGLLNSLPMHDFSSLTLLNKQGTVLASTDGNISGAYINVLCTTGRDAFFEQATISFVLKGDAYYFAKVISEDYRLMGIILQSTLLTQQTQISSMNAVEVVIILIVIAICITLIILAYRQKFNVLYRVKPVNNYTLTTTKGGAILYADAKFNSTFGKVKFHEGFMDKNITLGDALTSGKLLLFSLKNKEQETRQIAFNVTSGLGQYKMVGSDVTDFMKEHNHLLYDYETDDQTGLSNIYPFERDWKDYIENGPYKDGMLCFLGVSNLDYYRTLYGEENYLKGLQFVAQLFAQKLSEYGQLYTVKGYNFLFVQTKEGREKFIANIRQIQESLCETIDIYNNFIKFDVRLGVVLLADLEKDTGIDYVFNAGMRALKYAKEIEDVPYYIQRATNFDRYQLITHEVLTDLINKDSLDVHFQPQIDVKTECVVGFESLFRFSDARLKDLTVFEFIASAEEHGCIVELGEFIYKKAMDFACLVQRYNISVSINISPIQLMQTGFVEKFLNEHKKRNIKPGIIHVEIVESTMIYSINDVIQKLEELKAQGIYAEIDDFGVAYSSMLYLKNLPITTLKIDKAFVDNIETSEKERNLLKNIINITKDFGLKSIAEGVEGKGQRDILEKLGCDIIQGFYYSRALPKDKVFDYIKKMNKLVEDN